MPVPLTSKNTTTLISSHLFRSLSSSSLFSLWCRRLCRAVGVTLGGGGQGVSRRSSGLEFSTGFTLKRCCCTTERIVLSRKLRGRNQRQVGRYSKLWEQSNMFFLWAIAKTRDTTINYVGKGPKSTYFAASGARWTGDRRLLKERQRGRRWVAATENRWSPQVTEQHIFFHSVD